MKSLAIALVALAAAFAAPAAMRADSLREGTDSMTAKSEIAELVNNWGFYRDQERWEELSSVFHPGGTISISWYDGPHEGFVEASKMIAAGGAALLKHQLGVPSIRVEGARAVSEVNVIIMVRASTPFGAVDTSSYARFIDMLEKRDGAWKIRKRVAVYEKDRIDPVDMPALPPALFEGLDEFPAELRFLAASMKRGGIELSKTVVLDRSAEMKALYGEADAWLAGQ
ncbi:nuclear transport factor 2 family protein [Parvibaculum sp.]|uniref:nuclear transport factor 2 family protein n=1 Tax=Parvibaculum sp. TaxID=2024848 RepID=UPI001B1E5042|nr:nuclear transport factor 2 family protein [Parvibaculum sp.]MBO6668734.1 nuclear transport factor 2 family protein [Parvibaculum sp.]MBO6691527.1 nuclear transport factor 2 family protein [Parvibaculum sp.]MBO6714411.1 nuclear transport factor 2 family protein [Parvibaculum sp.]